MIVPLAVINRQTAVLKLNPFGFFEAEPAFSIALPLIVLLGLAFFVGLVAGWVTARLLPLDKKEKPAPHRITLPDVPIVGKDENNHIEEENQAQMLTKQPSGTMKDDNQ